MKKQPPSNKLTEEELDEVRQKMKETPLEKGDFLAIVIAAFMTILPLVLVILGIFVLFIWLFFIR